eukprot:gene8814-33589_t
MPSRDCHGPYVAEFPPCVAEGPYVAEFSPYDTTTCKASQAAGVQDQCHCRPSATALYCTELLTVAHVLDTAGSLSSTLPCWIKCHCKPSATSLAKAVATELLTVAHMLDTAGTLSSTLPCWIK